MSTKVHESKQPLNSDRLKEFEHKFEMTLPNDYRDFLLTYNGGYPEPDGFWIQGMDGNGSLVDRFLGIHGGEHDNLLGYLEIYKERIPPNFLPIAHDPGGNLICMSVEGEDKGKIYFWDHEEEADPDQGETAGYQNVYLIADSFTDFFENLIDFDE